MKMDFCNYNSTRMKMVQGSRRLGLKEGEHWDERLPVHVTRPPEAPGLARNRTELSPEPAHPYHPRQTSAACPKPTLHCNSCPHPSPDAVPRESVTGDPLHAQYERPMPPSTTYYNVPPHTHSYSSLKTLTRLPSLARPIHEPWCISHWQTGPIHSYPSYANIHSTAAVLHSVLPDGSIAHAKNKSPPYGARKLAPALYGFQTIDPAGRIENAAVWLVLVMDEPTHISVTSGSIAEYMVYFIYLLEYASLQHAGSTQPILASLATSWTEP
ncbi:hypothetical protein DFH27DRAFT_607258 [Peziza echinospora]|nr:hypothetical protein DFH27DRAFT_607258 [Peziza echinospora]